jgi:DNA-binding NarL/FixJ family response regulator
MTTTILIVDGYVVVRAALRTWLEVVFPATQVVEAANGEEALTCIKYKLPSLVIIDILLPGTNGISTTRQIRAALPFVPIIVLTMYEDEEYRTEMMNAGADAFIAKREMHSKLMPRVKMILDTVMV